MARQAWGVGRGVCSQIIASLGHARPGIIYTYAWVCPHAQGHHGAKQVFARLLPVFEVKAMYYLSGCWVLYVRKASAICALEACVLCSQPSKQALGAHLRLQRSPGSQRRDFLPRLCLQHPCSFSASLGPLGSALWDIPSEGVVCIRAVTMGWEGPSSPTCVLVLSLGHKLTGPLASGNSQVWDGGGITRRN